MSYHYIVVFLKTLPNTEERCTCGLTFYLTFIPRSPVELSVGLSPSVLWMACCYFSLIQSTESPYQPNNSLCNSCYFTLNLTYKHRNTNGSLSGLVIEGTVGLAAISENELHVNDLFLLSLLV